MRAALTLCLICLVGCASDHGGLYNGQESGTKLDNEKRGRSGLHGPRDGGSIESQDGSVDQTPDASTDATSRDGGRTQEAGSPEGGTEGGTQSPQDIFAGTFEVTTTYHQYNLSCIPNPVTTTLVITKVDAAEYHVVPTKATRYVVSESWFIVDTTTLEAGLIDALKFTTKGFTGSYSFAGSIGTQPGATGNCSYSGYSLKGTRK